MDTNDLIQAYSKDPVGYRPMQDFCAHYFLVNSVCGDDIEVFLQIDTIGRITAMSYQWSPSMFTITAASLMVEDVMSRVVQYQDLLSYDLEYIRWLGFDVSPRRTRSAVAPLLACKNAIHQWLGDEAELTFEDEL
jgi:NifU-like protein involved in Fe-S cluster formation